MLGVPPPRSGEPAQPVLVEESEPEEELPRKASRSKKTVRHLAATPPATYRLTLDLFRPKLPDRVLVDLQMCVLGFFTRLLFWMLTMLVVW